MSNQIIFFLALAAFIIVLSRRYRSNSGRRAGEMSKKIIETDLNIVDKVESPKISLPKWRFGLPKRKPVLTADGSSGHEFWDQESAAHQAEISSHFEEAQAFLAKGQVKEAEQFLLKAAANNPGDAKVYAKLGLLYLNQKNYSDSIESLKMAVKLEKYNPSRHYNLALAYWGNKDTRRAIASAREAISLDPVTQKYRKLLEELLNG